MDEKELKDLRKRIRHGCFGKGSPIFQKLCPPPADCEAPLDEQTVINMTLEALKVWALPRISFRFRDIRESVIQNLICKLLTKRPDLFFNPARGTIEAHLAGILKRVLFETLREERPCRPIDHRRLHQNSVPDVLTRLQRRESIRGAVRIMRELPKAQWMALKSAVRREGIPSDQRQPETAAEHLHRFRGRKAIRKAAESRGLSYPHMPEGAAQRNRPRRRPPRGSSSQRLRNNVQNANVIVQRAIQDEMDRKSTNIEQANKLALQRLLAELPPELLDRADVLAAVVHEFETQFARRLHGRSDRAHLRRRRAPGE